MRPDERDIDDEIRGHIALAIKDRVDRGEDPEAARRAAYAEFGYLPAAREDIRRVWFSRGFDALADFGRDVRVGVRSLGRAKGLSAAVVVTLALGIGANAAIFSVVRGVLLRPLVNDDEDRLVYLRQSVPGVGSENLTFSVPEIQDLQAQVTSASAFGDFSTIDFTLIGAGEPRIVKAGVVSGAFFDVMGLRPVVGRLLTPDDDGPGAAGAVVLTYRFWTSALGGDRTVVGRTIRLDSRPATVVGVLEPSVPYPADTELIANVVTSPHHLDATMVTGRTHRMTELFARLRPEVSFDQARAEITAAHAAIVGAHPEAYGGRTDVSLTVRQLRDQIASPAKGVLLVLLGTAAIVFVVACANVANLILARSVRREGELAVRAALGASRWALRRTLLAESVALCGAGAVFGVLLAGPLVDVVARLAARFSVRALDVSVDGSVVWVGTALAMMSSLLLAYVPRLPAGHAPTGLASVTGGPRVTTGTTRRLRMFAAAQIACSFLLLAAASALLTTLLTLQASSSLPDAARIVAADMPLPIQAFGPKAVAFYDEVMRRVSALPDVRHVAVSNVVPWRDRGTFGPFPFGAEGHVPRDGQPDPQARLRNISPAYFETLGLPIVEGRAFTADDPRKGDPVAIVSASIAEALFPDGQVLGRHVWWKDPVFGSTKLRIVGVAADLNDERVMGGPAPTIYHPLRQVPFGGRLLVQTAGDPAALAPAIARVVREISGDQPIERLATLAEIRNTLITPDRVNAVVVGGFSAVALLIAVVGVAGVLAFSVSARTREFGVRLAVGSTPGRLMAGVVGDGLTIVVPGLLVGGALGYSVLGLATGYVESLRPIGALPAVAAAALIGAAAVAAALLPARRASRVDVLQALRTE